MLMYGYKVIEVSYMHACNLMWTQTHTLSGSPTCVVIEVDSAAHDKHE